MLKLKKQPDERPMSTMTISEDGGETRAPMSPKTARKLTDFPDEVGEAILTRLDNLHPGK